jgi:hypothetical protein
VFLFTLLRCFVSHPSLSQLGEEQDEEHDRYGDLLERFEQDHHHAYNLTTLREVVWDPPKQKMTEAEDDAMLRLIIGYQAYDMEEIVHVPALIRLKAI